MATQGCLLPSPDTKVNYFISRSSRQESADMPCSADEPMTTFCECQSCGKSVVRPYTLTSTFADNRILGDGSSAERQHREGLIPAFSGSSLAFQGDGIPGIEMACL